MIDSWYDLAFPAVMLWLWTAIVFEHKAVVIE